MDTTTSQGSFGETGSTELFCELFHKKDVFIPVVPREVAKREVQLMGVKASSLGEGFHHLDRVSRGIGSMSSEGGGNLVPKGAALV